MALADILAKLGEDETTQEQALEKIINTATELGSKVADLTSSVEKLEAKRDELLGEKKKLSAAAKIFTENGINPDDPEAAEKLKAKLAAKGEKSSDSDLEVIELRSALNKINTKVEELTTRAETAEQEKENLKKSKIASDIESKFKEMAADTAAGVCLSPSKFFHFYKDSLVMAQDGKTVLWKDGDDLKSLDDLAAASASNPDDSIFWAGKGSSGTGTRNNMNGLQTVETSHGTGNPFEKGGNATQASKLLKNDPKTASRMIAEARQRGKLAPAYERMMKLSNS